MWYKSLSVNVSAVQTDSVVSEDQPTEEDPEVNEEDEEANIPDFFDQDPTWDPETIDSEYDKIRNEDDSANTDDNPRLDFQGKNAREEPKGIVFLSKLMLLFQFCHLCLFPKPNVAVT